METQKIIIAEKGQFSLSLALLQYCIINHPELINKSTWDEYFYDDPHLRNNAKLSAEMFESLFVKHPDGYYYNRWGADMFSGQYFYEFNLFNDELRTHPTIIKLFMDGFKPFTFEYVTYLSESKLKLIEVPKDIKWELHEDCYLNREVVQEIATVWK